MRYSWIVSPPSVRVVTCGSGVVVIIGGGGGTSSSGTVGGLGRSLGAGWARAAPAASARAASSAIVERRGSSTESMVGLDSNARV